MLLCASNAQRSPFFRPFWPRNARAWTDHLQQFTASDDNRFAVMHLLQELDQRLPIPVA
jgi:hypothetical protein